MDRLKINVGVEESGILSDVVKRKVFKEIIMNPKITTVKLVESSQIMSRSVSAETVRSIDIIPENILGDLSLIAKTNLCSPVERLVTLTAVPQGMGSRNSSLETGGRGREVGIPRRCAGCSRIKGP
ncbi:hypothetical protein TNCV_1420901 [Trichonephila clavipes]|nr:hypothetical protein TNCV_1420901 [Trichonephila clavipes]